MYFIKLFKKRVNRKNKMRKFGNLEFSIKSTNYYKC